eukprot:GHVS01063307.1.p1 GENE.GHVS01063307.1~~GHVS01063307.1.p1  ORF type:complete len:263 (-),score=16.73 GHVS01063307.1:74-862(-)
MWFGVALWLLWAGVGFAVSVKTHCAIVAPHRQHGGPQYRWSRARSLTNAEQCVEDANRLETNYDTLVRYYVVMPLTNLFQPPIGHFSHGHVLQGDKISLPRSMLDLIIHRKVEVPWQFALRTTPSSGGIQQQTRNISSSVLDFRSPENYVFIPQWMMTHLKLRARDVVQCELVKLPEAVTLMLRPHSDDFFGIPRHRAVMENRLRHYSSLTRGSTIVLKHNGKEYLLDVVDITSGGLSLSMASIQDCDVATTFLATPATVEH